MKIPITEFQEKVLANAQKQNENSEKGQSDENYERMKGLVGLGISSPSFKLTQEERLGLFDSILECLESGDDNKTISKNVVSCFEDKLAEMDPEQKIEVAPKKGLKGPVFRRSGQ
jgi:hypothetical protein